MWRWRTDWTTEQQLNCNVAIYRQEKKKKKANPEGGLITKPYGSEVSLYYHQMSQSWFETLLTRELRSWLSRDMTAAAKTCAWVVMWHSVHLVIKGCWGSLENWGVRAHFFGVLLSVFQTVPGQNRRDGDTKRRMSLSLSLSIRPSCYGNAEPDSWTWVQAALRWGPVLPAGQPVSLQPFK